MLERIGYTSDGNDFDALDRLLGPVGERDQGAPETELGRLAQALLPALDGTDFPSESDFTEYERFC